MKKRKIRNSILIFTVLAALGLSACSAKQQGVEQKGYDTPEKTVSAYLDGFKKMDLGQMMGTFAIESYAENYDFEGQLERVRAYIYGLEMKIPNATPLAVDLNRESRRSSVSTSILTQYMMLSSPDFDLLGPTALKDEKEVKEFTEGFTRKIEGVKTDTIKLLGFIPPEELSDHYTMEANKKNIAKRADVCGADEIVSRAAVFELNQKKYLMCVDVANYGGRWYLAALGGNIGTLLGLDALSSGVVPLSEADLDEGWEKLMVPVS